MKKRFLLSAICAAAILLCAVATMNAQEGGGGGAAANAPQIPQLPYHLVENFFHYPANSIVGRVSGIAVGPKGNIMALNRGYHPVQEFNAGRHLRALLGRRLDDVRRRACRCASIRRAISGMWTPPMTSFTASTPKAAPWARWEQTRSPGRG